MCAHKVQNLLVPFIFDDRDLISIEPTAIESSEESVLPSGTAISEYKIVGHCGKGGNGDVHSATHKGNDVAIKFISDSSLGSHSYTLAKRELDMLNDCKGLSNVLKLLDWGADRKSDQFFIVTELLKPIDIASLDSKRVQQISRGIFNGLKELHRKEIIHGDLKPENCLLNAQGEGVIIDFGHAAYEKTKKKKPIQSSWYRDPRVFINAPYDRTVDLWSMGCILFQFATNTPLFPGECYGWNSDQALFLQEMHTLHLIAQLIGHPTKEFVLKGDEYFPFFSSDTYRLYDLPNNYPFSKGNSGIYSLKELCTKKGHSEPFANQIVSLIGRLVTYGEKISAEEALQSPFYAEKSSS